jgi:hypothetical protein
VRGLTLPLRSHDCGSGLASLKNQLERRYGQHPLHAGPNSVVSKSGRENFKSTKTRTLPTGKDAAPKFKIFKSKSEGWPTRPVQRALPLKVRYGDKLTVPMTPANSAAEWINAISVVVLVAVTWYYARTNNRILKESEKMRRAAELQAAAAAATLRRLKEQAVHQNALSRSIVRTTIDSAIQNAKDWKGLIRINFVNGYTFPSPDNLVPADFHGVMQHAREISLDCANSLSSAFDDLRSAQKEIEVLRQGSKGTPQPGFFDPARYDLGPSLTSALEKLQDARRFITYDYDELRKSIVETRAV